MMRRLKIYLDNCCYNRPYDDQANPKVVVETLAKLYIQELILKHAFDLVWSYVLKFENSQNSVEAKRTAIAQWEKLSIQFVGKSAIIVEIAKKIAESGIQSADALHIACAINAHCDYLITVDKRMIKYRDDRIVICSPIDFINRESESD